MDGTRRAPCVTASNTDKLRQVIEVAVACMQREVMLQDQGGQPHVISRNRRALFPELAKHCRVMMCGLIVGKKCVHALLQEEAS